MKIETNRLKWVLHLLHSNKWIIWVFRFIPLKVPMVDIFHNFYMLCLLNQALLKSHNFGAPPASFMWSLILIKWAKFTWLQEKIWPYCYSWKHSVQPSHSVKNGDYIVDQCTEYRWMIDLFKRQLVYIIISSVAKIIHDLIFNRHTTTQLSTAINRLVASYDHRPSPFQTIETKPSLSTN